jgi:hypothetical protein
MIADGTSLNVYGVQVLALFIHGRQFQCKMLVADLTVDGILGLGFLQSNNCHLISHVTIFSIGRNIG